MSNEIDPKRQKIEKQRQFIIQFLYWGIIAICILLILKYAGPILVPFLIAFLIAFALHKPIDYVHEKTHLKRPLISIVFVLITYCIIGTLIGILGAKVFSSIKDILFDLPIFFRDTMIPFVQEVFDWLERLFSTFDPSVISILNESASSIIDMVGNLTASISKIALSIVSDIAAGVPGVFMKTIITLIVTVFMTIDFHPVTEFVLRQIPEKQRKTLSEGKGYIVETLIKCLKSYTLIIFMTFLELFIGFKLLSIPNAAMIAVAIAIIDILPVLGTGGILIPWAIIAAVLGNIPLAIGIIVLYLVITIIRNIVEPKLVGQQVGLHPVVTLASMLLGLNFCGIIGLFGFPIALSLIMNLNNRGIIHIFK